MSIENSIDKLAAAIALLAQAVSNQAPAAETPPGGCCGEGEEAKKPQVDKPRPESAKTPRKDKPAKQEEAKQEAKEDRDGDQYLKLQNAVVEAVTRAGRSAVVELLGEYGVKKASDIEEAKWAGVIEKLEALDAE